jgi:hypothetical protein
MNADDVVVKPPINYATDPVFQQFQYYVRLAFEEGYRAGKPDTIRNEWRDNWQPSKCRAFLVENGLITGNEGYK